MLLHQPNPCPTADDRARESRQPEAPVVMRQRWRELLFLHWPIEPDRVAATLPPGLTVDCHEGRAWLGVVPFFMEGVRPRFLPAIPGISSFPELNLRTYVFDRQGRPGVWFYSLDTPKRLANWIARNFFHLSYQPAEMTASHHPEDRVRYQSRRLPDGQIQRFSWQRQGPALQPEPGSLDYFLIERYRLFAYDKRKKRLFSGRVHHAPYPVQEVDLGDYSTDLFGLNGLAAPTTEPLSALASAGVDVQVYPLARVD